MKQIFDIILFIRKKIARLQGKTYIPVGKCLRCGSCCRMVTLVIDQKPIKTWEEFDHLKKVYPEYCRFEFCKVDDQGHMIFSCKMLDENNLCTDHKNRLQICREYPNQQLLMRGGKLVSKCGFNFIPVEDFQKILDDIMRNSEADEEENPESD